MGWSFIKATLQASVFLGIVLYPYQSLAQSKTKNQTPASTTSPHKAQPQPTKIDPKPSPKKEPQKTGSTVQKKKKPRKSVYKGKFSERALWYVDVVLFSVGTIALNKTGLGLGMNLWQFASVELEAVQGSHKATLLGIDLKELNETILTAKFRLFPLLNSFNASIGWGRRDLEIRILDLDSTTATQEGWEGGIGNRWSFGPLTVAVDWLSIWTPVRKPRYTENDVLTLGALEDESDKAKEQLEKISESPSVSALKLSLGFQF